MTPPRPGPRRVRLASLLAALALAVPLAAAPSDPAAAAESPAQVTLTAADITGTRLTLRGTLTNTGTDPLRQVTVALWRSPDLLLSTAAVEGALVAGSTTTGTARVVEDANADRLLVDDDSLSPGESRGFAVSGILATLGLTATDATWWAGIDATGRVGSRRLQAVGSARTLVSTSDAPHPVSTVVEFSAPPRQIKKDLFGTDDLQADLAGGRLDLLMGVAEGGGTSWVIDPSLLAEVEDMADGYRVQTPDGTEAGTGQEVASAWLARLAALPSDRGATELFGSPDLSAVAALADATVSDAISAATAADTSALPQVAVLDRPDASSLKLAADLHATIVALDADAPAVRVDAGPAEVVVASTGGDAGWSSPLMPDTEVNRRAARYALARAAGGEVRWVRSPEEYGADAGPLPQGFVAATLAGMFDTQATKWTPPPAQTPVDAVLDAGNVGRVLGLRRHMAAYAAAAPDSGVAEVLDAQTARAASRWWADDRAGQEAWLAGIERRVALPEGDMVTLDASPRFSMTGANSEFPVTVTNHLQDPVTVQVVADTDNPQRIRLIAPGPVRIASGASSTVLLQAEAAGGGVVRARVHVETTDGHRLTPDREIAVETTNFGTIGWVIVIASGLVLVVTTASRIRQVRGQRKGEDG